MKLIKSLLILAAVILTANISAMQYTQEELSFMDGLFTETHILQQFGSKQEFMKFFFESEITKPNCSTEQVKFDKWAQKLVYFEYLLSTSLLENSSPIDSTGMLNQLASKIIIDLKENSTNLWVKYYANFLYATAKNLNLLDKVRGYKDYAGVKISESGIKGKALVTRDANIGLKIEELLLPVIKQNINILAKAKAALYVGIMRRDFAKNYDYTLAIKYFKIAQDQQCDEQTSITAKNGIFALQDIMEKHGWAIEAGTRTAHTAENLLEREQRKRIKDVMED